MNKIKTVLLSVLFPTLALVAVPIVASAHAIVTPNTAGIASFQTFTLAVPSEKDASTVSIKLLVPDGVEFVVPDVKSGWKVSTKTQATGKTITDDDGNQIPEIQTTEIDWAGGAIPSGQRDEFSFNAQVPASPTTLDWKVYQTYSDGSVVSWDQDPASMTASTPDSEGPYSHTDVIDDLSGNSGSGTNGALGDTGRPLPEAGTMAVTLSLIALVLSIVALVRSRKAE